MFTMSKESMDCLSDCHYEAHLEWEKALAVKNLRYYRKSYARRLCDTEEFASDEMRGAVGMVLDRRYGEKIRAWRARELFANQELAKLAAKREAAKVVQMAQQVSTWAQAHRSQHPAAQQEQLPFFEPGPPSGSYATQSATETQAAQQETMWPVASADERDDENETDGDAEEPVQSAAAATLADADPGEESDKTEADSESTRADAAAEAGASSSRIVPKELVAEASAFAAANPVPQCDIEAALSRQELVTDAVPLSQWTAQLLWTQSGEVSLAPWFGVKWPSPLSSTAESSGELGTEASGGEPHDRQAEPPDER